MNQIKENLQEGKIKNYKCYSPFLFQFLVSCGVFPNAIAYHSTTKARIYIFTMTDQLQNSLTLYKNKPHKKL